jgi:hypothetical protein
MVGYTTIMEINEATGEPLAPGQIKMTFVNQLGYLVRESIPIKYKLWKRNKVSDRLEDIVPDSEKDLLWKEVSLHFNFPPDLGMEVIRLLFRNGKRWKII